MVTNMYGLGTIVNIIAILIGGLIGLTFGRILTERVQNALIMACGISTVIIGLGGAMEKMLVPEEGGLVTAGSMMLIASLVGGVLIGELLRVEDRMDQFGEWLKKKTGNEREAGFVNAFVTASLTVCVGGMAVVGPIEDGIYGNHTVLYTKAILDFVIIIIMSASLGKGCIFSALSVGLVQGLITLLARLIEPLMTESALSNLSFVGSVLIFCVGINLVLGVWFPPDPDSGSEPVRVRVGNLLPGIVIAVAWAFLPFG